MVVKKTRCSCLAETIKMIEASENDYQYSVSWIDCLAGGKNLGRSILILGRHARAEEIKSGMPLLGGGRTEAALKVPLDMPSFILNRYSIGVFNALYYYLSQGNGDEKITHLDPFFYPLDLLSDWNRMYGKAGFVQYQCALPLGSSRAGLEEILTLSSNRGRSSFLAVLKKFGPGHGLLSFPLAGFTLALDIPVKPGLFQFLQELDAIVIKYGGRVYLAKDACLSSESLPKMYPELPKWTGLKKAVDAHNRFSSALSERLKLPGMPQNC